MADPFEAFDAAVASAPKAPPEDQFAAFDAAVSSVGGTARARLAKRGTTPEKVKAIAAFTSPQDLVEPPSAEEVRLRQRAQLAPEYDASRGAADLVEGAGVGIKTSVIPSAVAGMANQTPPPAISEQERIGFIKRARGMSEEQRKTAGIVPQDLVDPRPEIMWKVLKGVDAKDLMEQRDAEYKAGTEELRTTAEDAARKSDPHVDVASGAFRAGEFGGSIAADLPAYILQPEIGTPAIVSRVIGRLGVAKELVGPALETTTKKILATLAKQAVNVPLDVIAGSIVESIKGGTGPTSLEDVATAAGQAFIVRNAMGLIHRGLRGEALSKPRSPTPESDAYVDEMIAAREAARKGEVGTPMERVGDFLDEVKVKMVDSNAPIEDVLASTLKKHGITLKPSEDITNAIDRALRAPSIAGQFARDHGLEALIQEVPDLKKLDQYLIADRALELNRRDVEGKGDNIETGRDLTRDEKLVGDYKAEYEPFAQRFRDYTKQLRNYLVESDLISRERADKMEADSPKYAPLEAIFNDLEQQASRGEGSKSVASLAKQTIVRKIVGSLRQRENPLQAIMSMTEAAHVQGEKNKAGKMLASYFTLPENPMELKPYRTAENVKERIATFTKLGEIGKEQRADRRSLRSVGRQLKGESKNLKGQLDRISRRIYDTAIESDQLYDMARAHAADFDPSSDVDAILKRGVARETRINELQNRVHDLAKEHAKANAPQSPGLPSKLYHRSYLAGIEQLEPSTAEAWGKGVYLTDSPSPSVHGDNLYTVSADLKNPYIANGPNRTVIPPETLEGTAAWKKIEKKWAEPRDAWAEDSNFVNAALRELGYDGVIDPESVNYGTEVVIFDKSGVSAFDKAVQRAGDNAEAEAQRLQSSGLSAERKLHELTARREQIAQGKLTPDGRGGTRRSAALIVKDLEQVARDLRIAVEGRADDAKALRENIKSVRDTPAAPGESTISFLNEGIRETWGVKKDIADAAKALDVERLTLLGKIFAAPTRVLKIGTTGINPGFLFANISKDQITAFFNSQHPVATSILNARNFVAAAFEAMNHGELYAELIREGGHGTSFDLARNQVMQSVQRIRAGRSAGTLAAHVITHPSEWLRTVENVMARGEELTRIQQYKGTFDKLVSEGMDPTEARIAAARAARENTVNFQRRGEWGTVMNAMIPYLNANIQGTRTFLRTIRRDPSAAGKKFAIIIGLPVLMTTAWNLRSPEQREAYDDIEDFEKENNFIIVPPEPEKNADGKWNVIKVPISQELNNAASLVRRSIEAIYGLDPLRFDDIAQSLIGTVSPVQPNVRSVMSTVTPTPVKGLVENYANKDFFTEAKIESDREVKMLPPEDRVKDNTSGTARAIGGAIDVGPKKVEHFIKAQTGEVGQIALNAFDTALAAAGVIPGEQIGGRSIPESIARRFTSAYGGRKDRIAKRRARGEK